jgi:hypothetical protein
MKLVCKTPYCFISCLYYSTENGSVDNWHVLIHTQLDVSGTHDGRTHRAWPAIISLDSKSIELRMNMHQQCLSVWCSPSPLHILQRYYIACMMCMCADQLVVIGGLVYSGLHALTTCSVVVAVTCIHLKIDGPNFLYWWGEFSRPGSTTCQHPQEVIANHNTKLATNLLQAMVFQISLRFGFLHTHTA